MLYKLYKNIFKSPPPPERRKFFSKLYQEHGVELIGVWKNKENPLQYYMLTKYQSEAHFQTFIESVRELPPYKEMTEKVDHVRISSEVVTLIEDKGLISES